MGSNRVKVSGEGFLTGEQLLWVFSAETDPFSGRKGVRLEARSAQAVSSDGTFTFEETLQPLNGGTLLAAWSGTSGTWTCWQTSPSS